MPTVYTIGDGKISQRGYNTHVVNDILFGVRLVRSRRVHGTHDVHLVVLERHVAFVHVDYVVRVVYPESETHYRRHVRKNGLDFARPSARTCTVQLMQVMLHIAVVYSDEKGAQGVVVRTRT